MAPKRSTKQSAGLVQPTLAFQTQRRTASAKAVNKTSSKPITPSARKAAPKREADVAEVVDVTEEVVALPPRPVLNPNDKKWDKLYDNAVEEMGTSKPIHAEGQTKVQSILRVFDMTSKYGPCVGMTRLERWERAKKWGLSPPEEIREILLTQQGEDEGSLRESVLYGWV